MLTLVEPPAFLPVSLSQIKAHLRLDHADEDDYLTHLNEVATQLIQVYLGRSLIKQTWSLIWKQPESCPLRLTKRLMKPAQIQLKFPPLLSLKSVHFLDGEKKKKIDRYFLNLFSLVPYLELSSFFEIVEIVYEAGYGERPNTVPAPICHAIMATITEFYETRETVSIPANNYVQGLLQPYRITRLL